MKTFYTFCLVYLFCSVLHAKNQAQTNDLYAIDLALNSIVSPVNGYFLSDQEIVSVTISNSGTQIAGPFTLSYQLGSVIITENFPGSVPVNDTLSYTFNQAADFSDIGLHSLKVWLNLSNDEFHGNDTLTVEIQNSIFTYCASAATSSAALDIGSFSLSNLHTSLPGTIELNPLATASYTDYTTLAEPARLIRGGQYTLSIQPYYMMQGIQNSVRVFIDWNADGQYDWQTESVYSGTQNAFFYAPYSTFITVPADAHTGITGMRVIVAGVGNPVGLLPCNTYYTGETEDYLVDIRAPGNVDAGIWSITQPSGLLNSLTWVDVQCIYRNYGYNPFSSTYIGYRLGDGPVFLEIANTDPILYWGAGMYTFSFPLLVPEEPFTLKVFTLLDGDEFQENDTCFMSFQVTPFCQEVLAVADLPNILPAPDDSLELKICPGTTVQFAATGLYPENDSVYHQSDATSVFVWYFSDGTTDTGQMVTHVFPSAGSYPVYVEIRDIHQCSSGITWMATVKVSPVSLLSAQNPLQICVNSPQVISVGNSPSNTLHIRTGVPIQENPVFYDSSTFIPDVGNTGGQVINLPIMVSAALPGSTLVSADDLEFVQMNMEHSFVGDLEISLECPNGTVLMLKSFDQMGGAYMGEPKGGVNHNSFDCLFDSCNTNPLFNPAGIGYNYRFSMNPVYSTMQTYVNGGNMPNPPGYATIDSSSYLPEDPFSILEGCPLNGTWTLRVADYWSIDNGWVFNWTLGLNMLLLPEPVMEVAIDTITFSGPAILSQQANQITIQHSDPGTYYYAISILDEFGCSIDTVLTVNVGIEFSAYCNEDIYLVNPGTASLWVTPVGGIPPYQYQWGNGSHSQGIMAYTAQTTVYYVTVTDAQGCNAVDSVRVAIGLVPNGTSFLNNKMEWSCYSYGYIGYPYFTTRHSLVLWDSLVNQVSYKKVWACPDEATSPWTFAFLARDNGDQRVYFLDPATQTEKLMFDFGLMPGDSALISSVYGGLNAWVYAWSRDTVFVANAFRPRIILGPSPEITAYPLDIWVKGLGSMLWGPFSRPMYTVGSSDTIICIHENNILIFQNPGFTSCHLENVGIAETGEQSLILYPNPVEDVSVFQTNTVITAAVVLEVYDGLGRLILTERESGLAELRIRHADFKPGLYLFRIQVNTTEFSGKFMIR